MKTISAILIVLSLAGFAEAGEIKIATVDMDRLVKEYYRAEQVAKDLEAAHTALFKELAEMRVDYDRLAAETRELHELASDSALNNAAREAKKKRFEVKLSDLRAFELRYEEAFQQKQTEWQGQLARANERLLGDILVATRQIGDHEGFNLVLSASKLKPLAGGVLFAKNVDDLTDKVLARLNATKPVPTEASPKAETKQQ